ncbi:cell surface protein [Nocardia stercoris]|uniref:Cell surface protein n=1 Tax=Nocardia stercoris TaxID=2483361 RepID=A0A3M2LM43_9NOCA|nr:cell surface protein [Nocardia stercoris]
MRRRPTVRAAAAIGAVAALTLSGCGGTHLDDIRVGPGKGWPSAYHDARNSAFSSVTGSRNLVLSWSRPIGGPVAVPPVTGPDGQVFVTTRTETGCVGKPGTTGTLFSFQMHTGRKRFCDEMGPDVIGAGAAVDGLTNVYVGDNGGVFSFNALGQPRWRTPVAGVPVSVQFTGDSRVLTVSQLGQIDVLDRQTGDRTVPTFQALGEPDFLAQADLPRPPDGVGLDDCGVGGPHCPVPSVSALDQASGDFYLTVWKPGSPRASLVALRYADGRISTRWSADLLTDGSAAGPSLSADGKTVYVGDNSNRLIAVDTATGHTKWTQPLGFAPRGAISAANGLLIPGGNDGHLTAVRDKGDSAEIAWQRPDVPLRGRPVQTAGDTGYTVAPAGEDGLQLVTFDTGNGTTLATADLPGAHGDSVGTAVGANSEVVITTRLGELFAFKPA